LARFGDRPASRHGVQVGIHVLVSSRLVRELTTR
jgi:hypothetical protein